MKTISFINNKGGVGKTASVTTIAHMLATKFNKNVLLVDMDPQSNSTSRYSRVNYFDIFHSIMNQEEVDVNILEDLSVEDREIMNKKVSVEDVLLYPQVMASDAIIPTIYDNLDILPAHLTLSEVEDRIQADIKVPQQFRLKNKLDEVQNMYDYCIIDCSPSISLLNINALAASDEVLIPINTDGDSLTGLAITRNLIETVSDYNSKLKIAGAFFTRFDKRKAVSKQVYAMVEELLPLYDIPLLPMTVPVSKLLEEISFKQEPLATADPNSKATQAYMNICRYIDSPNRSIFLSQFENNES